MAYLKLDNPCSENWDDMTPNENGRFCDKCAKTVIDFSKMDNVEISKIMQNQKTVCARILEGQFKEPLLYLEEEKERKRNLSKVAASLFLATTLLSNEAKAQNEMPFNTVLIDRSLPTDTLQACYLSEPLKEETSISKNHVLISGKILLKDSVVPIINAKVSLITIRKQFVAYTDKNGDFAMDVPEELIYADNVMIFDFKKIKNNFEYDQYIKNKTLVYGKENLLNKIDLQVIPEELVIMLGGVGYSSNYIEPKPLVFLDGNKIKYNDFVKARYKEKGAKLNLDNKEYIFFESFYANALIGREAPGGVYLIYSKE